MKAVMMKRSGDPSDVLAMADIPEPAAPADGDVIVRVRKRLVHPADTAAIRGFLPAAVFAPDGIPGFDGVGIVQALGANVEFATGVMVGSRVALLSARKTWAECVVTSATQLMPVPDDIEDEVACQLATNGITALMLLHAAGQVAGSAGTAPLLMTAAASGVARNMIALSSQRGRHVIGLVRRDADASALAGQFDNLTVIGTDRPDWQAAVRAAANSPVKVAIDPIGGEMMPMLLESVADGGTLIVYGGLDPRPSRISSGRLTGRELTIRGLSAFGWSERTPPEQRAADFESLFAMARRMPQNFGGHRTFPLADAVKAIAHAEASPRRGATILASDD
ncbi:putative oxidoreductase [Candidatus Burkholderia pumila]|uniref:Oxidoreductase n=1 Tax=Candidatus Burkholderia pumila TaxID=1090375 RepID=A0ABR5HLH2_9BURK|nr:putative oxidoreductase [Candidatus Burkholderia pumila]